MQTGIFADLDLASLAFGAFMALITSVLMTLRARNAQRLAGKPLAPWSTTLPDTGVGIIAAILLTTGIPHLDARFNTFTGVAALAALGGMLGPKLFDMLSANGVQMLLQWAAGLIKGPLGTWAGQQAQAQPQAQPQPPPQEGGDANEEEPQPPTPGNPA